MAKKREAGGQRWPAAPEPRRDPGAVAAVAILGIVLVGTALAVDTAAAAAFDAPKRLIALVGTGLAAAVAFAVRARASAPIRSWRLAPAPARASLVLTACALAGAFLAALASPRRAVSLDAMRSVALLALLLPLGASRAVARGRMWLAGAYAGNVGYLAIALALASVLTLGILVTAAAPAARTAAGCAFCLFVGALLVNQNLTALTALAAGGATLLVLRLRKRAGLPLAAAFVAAALAVAVYAPLRHRAGAAVSEIRSGNWDGLLSFRGGPWAAALEMTRERPLSGFGPGAFGAEYVPHRLSAEIRAHRRFVSPLLASSYAEAHSDYLQLASDAGVPVALLAAAAAACLIAATARVAWRRNDPEAALLLAMLVTGAAAALTWFPFQRPVTAVPLLLAAGRAWRIGASRDSAGAPV
ncbi:MAG: O-antigen ligase family protein [Acidobacteriota bacterium]